MMPHLTKPVLLLHGSEGQRLPSWEQTSLVGRVGGMSFSLRSDIVLQECLACSSTGLQSGNWNNVI